MLLCAMHLMDNFTPRLLPNPSLELPRSMRSCRDTDEGLLLAPSGALKECRASLIAQQVLRAVKASHFLSPSSFRISRHSAEVFSTFSRYRAIVHAIVMHTGLVGLITHLTRQRRELSVESGRAGRAVLLGRADQI